jgi:hypothetical protein
MQLNKPNTLGYLDPTNKEFYYKRKKDQDANFALLPKHPRVKRKLIIKKQL